MICSGSLFSQTYSLGNQSKWNQLSNVLVSCDLNLLKDNRYYILLSVGTSELVQNIFPSYGFFHKEGNMYYLQDIPSGANIVLEEINHSNLIVRKGFSFMENELFFYENDADDSFSYLLDFKDRCESVPIRRKTGASSSSSLQTVLKAFSLINKLLYAFPYIIQVYSPSCSVSGASP